MYFKNTTIQNYKSIQNISIEFDRGINLLIGDNGVGKTSILEALTIALGGFLSGIVGVPTKGILQSDIRIMSHELADASSVIQYMTPTSIKCCACIDGHPYDWERIRESETGSSKTKTIDRRISAYATSSSNDLNIALPLLSYIGTNRVSQPKRGDFGNNLKKKLDDRRCGYIGCLDSALDPKSIKAWCLKMEMVSFSKNQHVKEYEAFKETVSLFMKNIVGMDCSPIVFYSRVFGDLAYTEGDNTLPISYLSAGYQSLLSIVMDMAYRLALLNPNMDNLRDSTGIVLIDELDMHLHPKWQWDILNALEKTFPNIQFIVATHSPIVISSCKNGRLIRIDEQQGISYPENAYAFSIEDIVEFRQGSLGIPKGMRALVNSFDEALNIGDYEKSDKILSQMIERYGRDNREVKNALTELELEKSFD